MKTLQDSGNSSGAVLVTWQEAREGSDETCASSVAEAAIGSPATGFADAGPVSKPGTLARPTGVFMDDAGDGWIVGTREVFKGFLRYGPIYRDSGAWLAFRPAGGAFRSPVALSASNTDVEPFIAGDGAGTVLVGWNIVGRGAYLLWGDSSGRLSAPHFFRGLQISSLGIDDRGAALIAGARTGHGVPRVDLLISGRGGRFSRPRVLARAPRTPPRQATPSTITPPTVRVGPGGQALVTWRVNARPETSEGAAMLAYRFPTGELAKPIRYPYYRLPESQNPGELRAAAVAGNGRAAFLVDEDFRAYLSVLTPDGRVDQLHQPLTPSRDLSLLAGSLAANATGEFVAAWTRHDSIEYTLGNNLAALPAAQAISTPPAASDVEPLVTISQTGEAAAVWLRLLSLAPPEEAIEAQSLAPGAAPVQIALHKPLR
jgi:hypothetical protein